MIKNPVRRHWIELRALYIAIINNAPLGGQGPQGGMLLGRVRRYLAGADYLQPGQFADSAKREKKKKKCRELYPAGRNKIILAAGSNHLKYLLCRTALIVFTRVPPDRIMANLPNLISRLISK